jgi:hypothetical protein
MTETEHLVRESALLETLRSVIREVDQKTRQNSPTVLRAYALIAAIEAGHQQEGTSTVSMLRHYTDQNKPI